MCDSEMELALHSKILANYFKELCSNYLPPYRETNHWVNQQRARINENIVFFLKQVARLVREERIDTETFKNEIKKIKDINILQAEILWYLQVAQLLTLSEYIEFHESNGNEEIIEHITKQVFENILEYKPNSSKIRAAILTDYVKTFFECSKQGTANRVSFLQKLMDLITLNLQQLYVYEQHDAFRFVEITDLMELFFGSVPDCDMFKEFLQHILRSLLDSSIPATTKSIFKTQEIVKNKIQNWKIFQFFSAISKFCNLELLMSELSIQFNTRKKLNCNQMLSFISFVGQSYEDGWTKLKALSNSILNTSFQCLDATLLAYTFIIARQGCFEKINNSFPSYLHWFSSTFSSDSKKPLNTKKVCVFFFDFLTELAPYDSAYYLKVHINRTPWVPPDCLPILNGYIALVKTQLSKLNVSLELGICENLTSRSAPDFDVENVMLHFEKTNNILSSVFQASLFCKEYYEKRFLVELLKKFEGKKSTRHKLILKLQSLGKIPNSMFKAYKALEKK